MEEFAAFFHQDFGITFGSVAEGADVYLRSLDEQRKKALLLELRQVLRNHPGRSRADWLKAWRRFGGQYWDRRVDLAASMSGWIADLERSVS